MSQSGLFTEHELPEHIYSLFDLKLDKDAFIRPTRDVVVDVYTRFLDKNLGNWRKQNPGQPDQSPLFRMVNLLRMVISRYEMGYEFGMMDLTNPNRKRTSMFMNAILLFQSEFYDEFLPAYKLRRAQIAEIEEKDQMYELELREERRLLEKEYHKKGLKPNFHEIEERVQARQREFEKKKKSQAMLFERKDRVKERISDLNRAIEIKKVSLQDLAERIERERQKRENKLSHDKLKEAISARDRELANLKTINATRLAKKQAENQKLKEQLDQIEQIIKEGEAESKAYVESRKKEMAEIEAKDKTYSEEVVECIARLESELDGMKIQVERHNIRVSESKAKIAMSKSKLDRIIGCEKNLAPQLGISKNSTFIKSSKDDQKIN